MKFEKCGLGFQNLYNMPKGVEVPWLTYQQFGNLVGNLTDIIVEEENWQPTIDAAWEMRSPEDYDDKFSTVKKDFLRTWHHSRSAKSISLEEMMADENGDIFGVADPAAEFEQTILSEMQIASFAADNLTDKDREILQLRMQGHTEKEIAEKSAIKQPVQSTSGSPTSPMLTRILSWESTRIIWTTRKSKHLSFAAVTFCGCCFAMLCIAKQNHVPFPRPSGNRK